MSLQLYQALAPVVRPGDLPSQLREIRNSFEAVECLPKALRVDVWKAFHIQVKPLLADIKDPQLPGIVRPIEYSIERRQPVAEYQASSYAERLAHYFMEGAIQGRGLSLETDRALIEGMLSAAHPRRYTPTYIDAGNTVTEWLRMDPSQWMEIIEPNVRQRASQFMSFLSTVRSLYVFLRESTPSILVPDLEIKLMAFNRLAASYHPQLKACDDVMLQLIFEPSEEHFVTYLKSRNLPSTVEATLETVDLSKASAGLVAKRGEEGPGVRVCYHGVLDEEGQVRAQPHFYLVDMGEGLTIQINIPKKTCELVFQEKRDERSLPLFHVDRIYCDKADYVVRY